MTLELIDRARGGDVIVGTFVLEFSSGGIGRLAAGAGAEFIIFDTEHTGWGWETIGRLVAATRSAGIAAWVRVPSAGERSSVSRALDLGASGVMAPMVEDADTARRLVSWSHYPPVGVRGSAFGLAHDDYDATDIVATIARENRDTVVIAQIETADGLLNVEHIAAVEGVDVLWVGQFDLTNSLGIPGRFDDRRYLSALDQVADAASRHGKVAGFLPTSVDQALDVAARGYRLLAYSADLWIYQSALASEIAAVRAGIAAPGATHA